MTTKHIMKPNGSFVSANDAWKCTDCGFVWGGKDRAPPYPHCPKCDNPFMNKCKQ